MFCRYLEAEGLFGQPASRGPPVVLWREGVGDAQPLAHLLKGVEALQPQTLQQLLPLVDGHQHASLVGLVLEDAKEGKISRGGSYNSLDTFAHLCGPFATVVMQTDSFDFFAPRTVP